MLTEAERAELETRVRATGLTMSEFVRRRALGVPLPASAGDQRTRALLATALLRLGVNLNQIAHHMNAGRSEAFFLPELITDTNATRAAFTHALPVSDQNARRG
jgi:hypothetical protein